ncbi:transcription factor SPT20-like protein [Gossypium australe]|uniref:Transcription factor SPT20-like protein n=1 Tax=Gossypium australe TaxID=47621 RepID=A0A5B6VKQ1_9ROSI|nr:transcription factor SPT20-like protein [Gossypium australe]
MVFDKDMFLFTPSSSAQCIPLESDCITTFVPILRSSSTHKLSFVPTNVLASPFQDLNLAKVNASNLVSLPSGRKAIGCMWTFKIKWNPDGTMARRKGRLVGKGYSQVPECDFCETFNLMVKLVIIRTILAVLITKSWQLRQVDVNNAFLNSDLTKEVYMEQPLRYV